MRLSCDVIANVAVEIVEHSLATYHDSCSCLLAGESARWRCELVPLAGFERELAAALRRQPVELGPAVVFGGALFERNPSPLDEPMQRRIERALLDLQDVVGVEFDGLGDGVAVGRSQQQGAQNQQVQSALQELDAFFFFFGRHSRWRVSPFQ